MAISFDIYWQKVIILISLSCLINYADTVSDLSHLSSSNFSSTVIPFGFGESFESSRKAAHLRANSFSQIFYDLVRSRIGLEQIQVNSFNLSLISSFMFIHTQPMYVFCVHSKLIRTSRTSIFLRTQVTNSARLDSKSCL